MIAYIYIYIIKIIYHKWPSVIENVDKGQNHVGESWRRTPLRQYFITKSC